jgi:hypothetical protein
VRRGSWSARYLAALELGLALTWGTILCEVGRGECGDLGLPPGIPIMHTIHDPRKTVVNPHNRVGIADYNIHYITSLKVLHRPLGRIQMPCRASSTDTLT